MKPARASKLSMVEGASRFWVALWVALTGLLVFVAALLIWLLQGYQASQEQLRVEDTAQTLAASLGRLLTGNLQDVHAVAWPDKDAAAWPEAVSELLKNTRSVLRIERRDKTLALQEAFDSPYSPPLFSMVPRLRSEKETLRACTAAVGPGLPAYSASYFVPLPQGRGAEVLDLCAAQQVNGEVTGFTVETIGLSALLETAMPEAMAKEFEASFIEGNATRIARGGASHGRSAFRAEHSLLLPGLALKLRLESVRGSPPLQLNFASASALVALLLFMTIVMFIVRETRRRARESALARHHQDVLHNAARLATLGEMASLISHEINQPLLAVTMYADAALHSDSANVPVEIKQLLGRIVDEVARVGRVVKSVQTFVRRGEVVHETMAPVELLQGIAPLLEVDARRFEVKLSFEIAQTASQVVCERVMIQQVILNLARNAMQAMERSTRKELRKLRISARLSSNGRVKFLVTDTGPGIPREVTEQIDEPFKKSASKGMGLGLSLCRSVIEQHGGVLAHRSIQCVDGSGSHVGAEFSFTLQKASASEALSTE